VDGARLLLGVARAEGDHHHVPAQRREIEPASLRVTTAQHDAVLCEPDTAEQEQTYHERAHDPERSKVRSQVRSLALPTYIVDMCTLALFWRVFPDAPVAIAANRDESPQRPWSDPHQGDGIFGGRDEKAGGTWLGVGPAGVV